MNFSFSVVAAAMRDSNSSFLFRTSSSLSVSSSSIRLLELSFSRSSVILLEVWTALSQLSCALELVEPHQVVPLLLEPLELRLHLPGPRELDLELRVGLGELLLGLRLLVVELRYADDVLDHLPLLVGREVGDPRRRSLGDDVEPAR